MSRYLCLAAAWAAMSICAGATFAGEEKEYVPPIEAVKVNGETLPAETIKGIYEYWLKIYKAPGKPLSNDVRDKLASVSRAQAVRNVAVRQFIEKNKDTLPDEAAALKEDLDIFKAELAEKQSTWEEHVKKMGKTDAEFSTDFARRSRLTRLVAAEIENDMENVKKLFEKEKAKLAMRRPSQIRFTYEKSRYTVHAERPKEDAKKLAEFALSRAKKGEEFSALAKQLSDEKNSAELGGDMGWIAPNAPPKPLTDAIYALEKAGDLAELVETDQGFHVVKLMEVKSDEEELKAFVKRLLKIRTLAKETKLGEEAKVEKVEAEKPADVPKAAAPEK